MNPLTHFVVPFSISLLFSNINFSIIAGLIGMFIDIDHYFEHIIHAKKMKFSLLATWNHAMSKHATYSEWSFIHKPLGIFFFTYLIGLISFFNLEFSLIIALGYYSHILLDQSSIRLNQYYFKLGNLIFQLSYLELLLILLSFILIVITL